MKKYVYFNICKNLILSDLIVLRPMFISKFIDISIWVILTIFVTGHVMPYFGLSANFGSFQFGGVIAAVGLFELYSSVVDFVSDLHGDRVIDYNLTLPIPSWLAILSKGIYYFIIYFILSIAVLPVGKIMLWNQFDLSLVHYFKLLLAVVFQNIFYASFTIWAGSIIEDMSKLGTIWSRFIFPMWFMGGFQFSWIALYSVTPKIAIINLLNPMIYVTESTRVALLGQTDYLNFWICLLMIMFFSVICFLAGLKNLKKRLDFIY